MGKKKSTDQQIPLGGALVQRTPINTGIEYPSSSLIDHINQIRGENSGALGRANYETALSRRRRAAMTADQVEARRRQPLNIYGEGLYAGNGLYANPHGGHGLYANPPPSGSGVRHQHHHHVKTIRRERGSVGIHGNLLGQPQALIPQPYAVNFAWGNTLPPYYQKYNRS